MSLLKNAPKGVNENCSVVKMLTLLARCQQSEAIFAIVCGQNSYPVATRKSGCEQFMSVHKRLCVHKPTFAREKLTFDTIYKGLCILYTNKISDRE